LTQAGELAQHQRGAEDVGQRLRLVVGERNVGGAGIRIVGVVQHQIPAAVPMCNDAESASGGGHHVVTYADSGQRRLFHTYSHATNRTACRSRGG
jgi:hypothetical protein